MLFLSVNTQLYTVLNYLGFIRCQKMAARSEEVLLIVNHVRNKKTDGTLYMMGERMGWMQGSKSTFSISYMYADIKGLEIVETV